MAESLVNSLKRDGFVAQIIEIAPPEPAPPKPPETLPQIQRTIGIEVDGTMTNEVGYLINNSTYVKASYIARLAGLGISGHGTYIKITK